MTPVNVHDRVWFDVTHSAWNRIYDQTSLWVSSIVERQVASQIIVSVADRGRWPLIEDLSVRVLKELK